MAIKCYFDGGNEPDSTLYKTLTLCAIAGTEIQWRNFEDRWQFVLDRHGAPYIHTTDMVNLKPPFSKKEGWDADRVDAVLSDCVSVIDACMAKPERGVAYRHGVMPISITFLLRDFKRALAEIPKLGTPELHIAMLCVQMCAHWADSCRIHRLQLVFDRNERFYGHVSDRWRSKRVHKDETIWENVDSVTEAKSTVTPALQAADVIAWTVGKKYEHASLNLWQKRLIKIHLERKLYGYHQLKNPDREALRYVEKWRLPKRRKFV